MRSMQWLVLSGVGLVISSSASAADVCAQLPASLQSVGVIHISQAAEAEANYWQQLAQQGETASST